MGASYRPGITGAVAVLPNHFPLKRPKDATARQGRKGTPDSEAALGTLFNQKSFRQREQSPRWCPFWDWCVGYKGGSSVLWAGIPEIKATVFADCGERKILMSSLYPNPIHWKEK